MNFVRPLDTFSRQTLQHPINFYYNNTWNDHYHIVSVVY